MPIYEYECEKCGKQVDVLAKVDDPPPAACESCGAKGKMSRQVSRTSFVLKGGGWYSDLYGSSKKDSGAGAPAAGAKTETKGETKSETKTDAKPASSSGGDKGGGSSSGGTPSGGSGSGGGSSSPPAGGSSAKPAAASAA